MSVCRFFSVYQVDPSKKFIAVANPEAVTAALPLGGSFIELSWSILSMYEIFWRRLFLCLKRGLEKVSLVVVVILVSQTQG